MNVPTNKLMVNNPIPNNAAVKAPRAFKQQSGFTLLEVLVAGFILFLVISTMTMIYRGAMLSSSKAERVLLISQSLPFILDEIRLTIRSPESKEIQQHAVEGTMFNVDYQWSAEILEFTAPPSRFDVDQTRFIDYEQRFKLWQVSLTIQIDQLERTYQYRETSW